MSEQGDCKTEIDANFIETITLLNDHAVPYWVCHGTLLGLTRDGKLIPWDHDIDIGVWDGSVSKSTIINLMKLNGFVLKSDGAGYDFLIFSKNGGRQVDFNYYKISDDADLAYSEWFAARSRFTSLLSALSNARSYKGRYASFIKPFAFLSPFFCTVVSFLKRKKCFFRSAGYTTPATLLQEFKFNDYLGVKVRVPLLFEQVHEHVYGEGWRTPKQQFDWVKDSPSLRVSNSRF